MGWKTPEAVAGDVPQEEAAVSGRQNVLYGRRIAAIHEQVRPYCCKGARSESAAGTEAGKTREAEERKDTLSPGKIPGLQSGYPPIRDRLARSLYQQRCGASDPVRKSQGESIRML